MSDVLCDICHIRPATIRAQATVNGRRETLNLCDVDYQRLMARQRRQNSPLESLFGGGRGSLFDDLFGDDLRFPGRPFGERGDFGEAGTPIPVRGGRGRRDASGITERLSTTLAALRNA